MKHFLVYALFLAINLPIYSQYIVEGYMKDFQGQGIEDVIIELLPTKYTVLTDANGYYAFKNVPQGNYTIKSTHIKYNLFIKKINVDKNTNLSTQLTEKMYVTDEVIVSASKVKRDIPISYTEVSSSEIEKINTGQDIPFLLQHTPSVVTTSDAGAGIGYTGIRIRGTDPTRINVTINGLPINDAESHGLFWVNMPDLASSTENIQIQRGVGTSTNGAAAFGASINLETSHFSDSAMGDYNLAFGSYNTQKHTIKLESGLINNHFNIEGRLSQIRSDGYIDRATSDLKSYYIAGGFRTHNQNLKLITFGGKEITYQSWNGTPRARLENDEQGLQNYISNNGLSPRQAQNLLNSDRRYNHYLYDNQVDNYEQTHYQALHTIYINDKTKFNTSLFYVRGEGFFEEFEDTNAPSDNTSLASYNLDNVIIGNDTITNSNIIRRRWLDNHFYGAVLSLEQTLNQNTSFIIGGGFNRYEGTHFGEVIWAQFASNGNIRHRYYDNDATKDDWNIYLKTNHYLNEKLNAYLDLQLRGINYKFLGFDNNLNNVTQEDNLLFFNPKFGLRYQLTKSSDVYASFAIGNKEPNRDDYTESSPSSRPEHETLIDYEIGYRVNAAKYYITANFYYMDYNDQLIPTGELNDVGASVRTNVEDSYRAGIELSGGYRLSSQINVSANITLSQNKIKEFNEFADDWDNGGKLEIKHENTDIALSPNVIANAILEYSPKIGKSQPLTLGWYSRYIGKQYLDNTSSDERSLDAYWVNDLQLNITIPSNTFRKLMVVGSIRNIFNELYSANGWVYRYFSNNQSQHLDGLYPQAETNFMLGLNIGF